MPYQVLPLFTVSEEFHFFVTVGFSTPFDSAVNPTPIESFRWKPVDLVSRDSNVYKTVENIWQRVRLDFSSILPV